MRFARPSSPILSGLALLAAALCLSRGAPAAAATAPPVVTILGDSITAGLGLPAAAALPAQLQAALGRLGARAQVRGAGVSGDTTAGGLARVDFSVQPDTALCIVELGANDFLQSIEPSETERNLVAIVRRLKARRIRVLLAADAAPRSAGGYGREFDTVFGAVGRAEHVPLDRDFLAGVESDPRLKQPDGLHPNAQGVRVIAARLAPIVVSALRSRP